MTLFVPILLILVAGGFEHVFGLSQLTTLEIDGFWDVFYSQFAGEAGVSAGAARGLC